MSETSTKELDSMEKVTEDAATGSTAIKKGATAGEKIDTSGAKHTNICLLYTSPSPRDS